ncbi:MAG: hypothetical protein H6627_06315 [Calditrichae bacterium]|nr:hypothetical protein [Calditrichota bacterium]MCB9058163.1 hypothetical protein [Calditrichia bacterium]
MKKVLLLSLIVLFLPGAVFSGNYQLGADLGYRGGLNISASGLVTNLAKGFPFFVRAGLSYTSIDPGKSAAARRIFINNATNGTPEKNGSIWDLRFDLLYKVNWFSLKNAYFFAGPRYAWFNGNFNYVGGNENFDVTSSEWGFGAGLETHYPVSNNMNLILGAGLDYYSTNVLKGHDTSYSSDGEIINGREDYNYDDADGAINQPTFEPRLIIGLTYLLK